MSGGEHAGTRHCRQLYCHSDAGDVQSIQLRLADRRINVRRRDLISRISTYLFRVEVLASRDLIVVEEMGMTRRIFWDSEARASWYHSGRITVTEDRSTNLKAKVQSAYAFKKVLGTIPQLALYMCQMDQSEMPSRTVFHKYGNISTGSQL